MAVGALSMRARLARWWLRRLVRPWLLRGTVEDWRRRWRREPPPAGARVEAVKLGGVAAEWLVGASAARGVIFYLHGGGFVLGSPATHRSLAFAIARAAGARALVPDYRLAPEHRFPAALDDCVAAYRALLDGGVRAAEVVIAGDSAGGGLALATLVALRDAGDPLPAGALGLSPATDLTLSGTSHRTRAGDEALLTPAFCRTVARHYLGGADPRAPLASPLFADLRGLPPLLLQVGTHELLLDDALRFADRARAAGVEVTLAVWPGLFHCFQHFPSLPEAHRAIEALGRFARARFAAAAGGTSLAEKSHDGRVRR